MPVFSFRYKIQNIMMTLAMSAFIVSCSSGSDSAPAAKEGHPPPTPPGPNKPVVDFVEAKMALKNIEDWCGMEKKIIFPQDWLAAGDCKPRAYPTSVQLQIETLQNIKTGLEAYLNSKNNNRMLDDEIVNASKYLVKSLVVLESFSAKAKQDLVNHEVEIKIASADVDQYLQELGQKECNIKGWSFTCNEPTAVALAQFSSLKEKYDLLSKAMAASQGYLDIYSTFSTKNYEAYALQEGLFSLLKGERKKVEIAMSDSYVKDTQQKLENLENETRGLFEFNYKFKTKVPSELLHVILNNKDLSETQLDMFLAFLRGEGERISVFQSAIQEVKELLKTKMLDRIEVGDFKDYESYKAEAYNYRETAKQFIVKIPNTASKESLVAFFKGLDNNDESKNPLLKERNQNVRKLEDLQARVASASLRTEMPVEVKFPPDELDLDTFLVTYTELNKYANEDVPEMVKQAQGIYGKNLFQSGYKIVLRTKLFIDVFPTSNSEDAKNNPTFELSVETTSVSPSTSFTFAYIRTADWIMAVAEDQSQK